MDVFGIKKPAGVAGEELEPDHRQAEDGAGSKRRAWAAILVLDVVFLFVFGGALAGIVYLRASTPPLAQVTARPRGAKREPPKAAPAPEKQEEAKPPEAKKEEPKKAEAPKAEAKPERPLGSPSVHAAALPRRAPEPVSGKEDKPAPKADAAAAAGGKVRAKPVEFTHKAPDAKEVLLRGAFLVRTGGRKLMVKDSEGVWRLSLSLLPGAYKYSFVADGKRSAPETVTVE